MDLLKPLLESGRIDFPGQDLASNLTTALLVLSAVVALAVGFVQNALSLTFYTYAGGVVLAYLAVLPAWPFYKRSQVNWLPRSASASAPSLVDSPNQPSSRKTLVEDVSDDDE
ncbi:hypothetical protein H4R99_003886 [Coemansia sp. RSA 1722]|nr:hypothetical protein IWW45_007565 [Coemansia sp. RSA 485]KAJ2598984.1 hypothetical protein H4R99_003886 [Coemansia sp. RSA 1722]KAJ2638432.1 hypothetical protein GGF40_001669 [Coemansia sp. RSA 1286]